MWTGNYDSSNHRQLLQLLGGSRRYLDRSISRCGRRAAQGGGRRKEHEQKSSGELTERAQKEEQIATQRINYKERNYSIDKDFFFF